MKIQHVGPKVAAILAFVVLTLSVLVGLSSMSGLQPPFGTQYELTARLPDGLQLVNNADVRASGVKVGRVVGIDNVGDQAQVRMQLDEKVLPVYKDATVQMRTKTLVGENYIDLVRGTPQAGKLPSGSRLPVNRALEAVQLDDILSTLDPRTRRHIRRSVRSIAGGLDGRGGDLNATLATFEPTFATGVRVTEVLDAQREDLAAIVDEAGQVMQAFGERTADVRTLATKLRATAVAAASRDEQLRGTLRELPATLDQTRISVTKLAALSADATPVVRDIATASRDLFPAIRDLGPASRSATATMVELERLLPTAEPLLRNLETFTERARPLAPALDSVLREVNPALAYLSPFHREFGAFFANVGSVVDTHDALGNLGRVHAVVSETSLAVWTPEMQRALNALLDVGGLQKLHREYTNSYPAPGTVGDPQPGTGEYPRLTAKPR